MQTLKLNQATFTLKPTRDTSAFRAELAKCTGKHKPPRLKSERRAYPVLNTSWSTAEYVRMYFALNNDKHGIKLTDNFAPLNTERCTFYTGEDTYEVVEESDGAL